MSDIIGDPALALSFSVVVDVDKTLGVFTACEGLGCEVVVERREEGGNNSFVHQFPVRITYQNIKLKRPINEDSGKVATWLASMRGDITPRNAIIRAMRSDGSVVASWSLKGVIPVKWQGPSLDVESNKVATESLELAHNGFLDGPA
jgi:phage tail-like protein